MECCLFGGLRWEGSMACKCEQKVNMVGEILRPAWDFGAGECSGNGPRPAAGFRDLSNVIPRVGATKAGWFGNPDDPPTGVPLPRLRPSRSMAHLGSSAEARNVRPKCPGSRRHLDRLRQWQLCLRGRERCDAMLADDQSFALGGAPGLSETLGRAPTEPTAVRSTAITPGWLSPGFCLTLKVWLGAQQIRRRPLSVPLQRPARFCTVAVSDTSLKMALRREDT